MGACGEEGRGMTLAWLALQFAVCAVLIARAGYVLSRSANFLADAHGWGRGWVGLALLATVTSLPELASGISAVTFVDAPNLAVGNALGACVVNLLFLVVVDALQRWASTASRPLKFSLWPARRCRTRPEARPA